MEQAKKTSIAKNLLFVFIMLAVVLTVVFSLNDISQILEALKKEIGRASCWERLYKWVVAG